MDSMKGGSRIAKPVFKTHETKQGGSKFSDETGGGKGGGKSGGMILMS